MGGDGFARSVEHTEVMHNMNLVVQRLLRWGPYVKVLVIGASLPGFNHLQCSCCCTRPSAAWRPTCVL